MQGCDDDADQAIQAEQEEVSMSNVYVVTHGSYSDYIIEAVFSTREKAERFQGERECEIEEWELDPEVYDFPPGHQRYCVTMRKDGASEVQKDWEPTPTLSLSTTASLRRDYISLRSGVYVSVLCVAKDEQHAVKIANEQRAGLIASGEWERFEERKL